MAAKVYRIGIVGASSLAGKELSDALSESALGGGEIVLLDDESVSGQLAVSGDEVAFIQRLEESSFAGMDFAFFAGSAEVTKKHWKSAERAGASIVDMSYALEGEPDVLVRAPWVTSLMEGGNKAADVKSPGAKVAGLDLRGPDLRTGAVVAAHPAAVMLALVSASLQEGMQIERMVATLMVPASEYGREAMDELHKQTVSLLSFQSMPKEQYDAQVSFNVVNALGGGAKMNLEATAARVQSHYDLLSGGSLAPLSLNLAHAPVFHGYVASVMLDLVEEVELERVEEALSREHVEVATGEADRPSNLGAAGVEGILVHARRDGGGVGASKRFWVWVASDNLKLGADNAISCAGELRRLRPLGKVQ